MGPFRLAVLDDYQGVSGEFADWSALPVRRTVFREHLGGPEDVVRALQPFDAIVAMRERTALPGEVLRALPRLRLIATTGMANAAIDLRAAAECGITVSGTTGMAGATATIEHAWALMLALARQVPHHDALVRAGGWQSVLGTTLHGKTLGIVGLGNIGRGLIPMAHALGMRVTAWSRHLAAVPPGVDAPDKAAFFAGADVLSVHIKLAPSTRHYVGAAELALVKASALLVNTSRGPIVDTGALVAALRAGRLAGAALDVFDAEPLPLDDPLRTAPNVLLSPHVGYVTRESYAQYFPQLVEDVAAFLAGQPIRVLEEAP
ncbi:D-2-hydroxyacid dehydrogenase family protein [Dactylosporangium sucinum]|uniref:2-hydroxyacid dehydrogenase n=1 Tax=Dactylosporangium sucinum TaxID=1424081 RepID=A0A917UF14_9ACTN|nr:D-2-hydroxyacid dehydrogenase family protein [Dactylosporangium sucinum]GGM78235.1 2-hydroxyacid dehydrogenase [Dactylosporangium sucinum]